MEEWHLDIYSDRSELHDGVEVTVFYEGVQSQESIRRYEHIQQRMREGFFKQIYAEVSNPEFRLEFDDRYKAPFDEMVSQLSNQSGRALVGLLHLQLAIKDIEPTQSIRLHKGGKSKTGFSWCEGISMRSLDTKFNIPYLREYNLLSINHDGVMMTRTLAENYPYSKAYKAEIKGVKPWLDIIESVEQGEMNPHAALCYLTILLKNRSDNFAKLVDRAIELIHNTDHMSFKEIQRMIERFYTETEYSARAFEIAIHSFMQAIYEIIPNTRIGTELRPISQMRNANKKSNTVGDIEIVEDNIIVEAWDAKFDKRGIRDEIEELEEKLYNQPNVAKAGFIGDQPFHVNDEIKRRMDELGSVFNVDIQAMSIDQWLSYEMGPINRDLKNEIAHAWIRALVESLGQKRRDIAPINEPCDIWLKTIINLMYRE